MFGIGGFELFIIVLFAFVIFGPDKLPEITKIAGRFIRKFRNAKAEMDSVLQEEVIDPVMAEANKPDKPKEEKKTNADSGDGSSDAKSVSESVPSDAVAATAKKKPIPDNADSKLAEELKKQEDARKDAKKEVEKGEKNPGDKSVKQDEKKVEKKTTKQDTKEDKSASKTKKESK